MSDRERMLEALRNADAAGDTEAAQRIAEMIRSREPQTHTVRVPVSRDQPSGAAPATAEQPAQGIGAMFKRGLWRAADAVPFLNLEGVADTLGAQESLGDYQNVQSLGTYTVRPPREGAELGVMEHYNPETGQVEYPHADWSQLGTLGRNVLGGLTSGAGFFVDAANAPGTWFYNNVEAPIRGLPKAEYSRGTQQMRGALVDHGLLQESVTDLPERLRPTAYGGEVLGASIPFAGALGTVNRVRSASAANNLAAGRGTVFRPGAASEYAAKPDAMFRPASFGGLGVQVGSATGAAAGAAAAEVVAPGDPAFRLGGEIIGSVFHPSHLAARTLEAGGGIAEAGRRVIGDGRFDPKSLQNRALQKSLVENIRRAGEDPEQVLAVLRSNPSSGFTSDIQSGSDGLRSMANYLRRQSPDFARQIDTKNREAWEVTLATADRLATSNAPEAVQSAASMYRTAFDDLFKAQVAAAESKAQQAASRLGPNSQQQMAEAGEYMAEVANDAYQAAKTFEREAWKSVPKDTFIRPAVTQKMLGDANSRVVDIQSIMPSSVRRFAGQMAEGHPTNSGEMLEFYFVLRDGAATYRAAGDFGNAQRLGQVANGILDDLASVPNVGAARTSSRELHDVFDRTFAGELLSNGAYGSSRVDPVTAAGRAIGGGSAGTQRIQRADELRSAAGYDPNVSLARSGESLPGVPSADATAAGAQSRAGGMQEALEQANLARLQGAIDAQTGRAKLGVLANRLAESEALQTPASQHLGREALSAEQTAQRTTTRAADRMARLDSPQDSTLARVLNREGQASTSDIVAATLKRADGASEYARIARVAQNKRLPEDVRAAAVDDLRAGTIGAAMKLGGTSGPFGVDIAKVRAALLDSPGGGRPSSIDLMERSGVIDGKQAQQLRQFFTKSAEAQRMLGSTSADIDVASPSAWFDALSRIAGAKLGGQVAKGVFGGTDIQTPGIMARLFQRTLRAMPQYNPQQAMLEVILNPNALDTALEAGLRAHGNHLTLSQASKLRKTTAGLLQAGLIQKEDYDEILVEIDLAADGE